MSSAPPRGRVFVTVCRGLESLARAELERLGASELRIRAAGVSAACDLRDAYRFVLWSRLASRVLWPIASFPARSSDEIYAGAAEVPWEEHLRPDGTIAVHTTAVGSAVPNTHHATLTVKDAIVDAMRDPAGRRPSVDTERPDVRVHLHLDGSAATLSIDLAGHGLYRRGYRSEAREAPLREDLAASILVRAGWPKIASAGGAFLDPMCGSGTLPIEAALMAGDVAPGLLREHFGFRGWRQHREDVWEELVREACARRDAGLRALPPIRGSDRDPRAIETATRNAARAGVSSGVRFEVRDLDAAEPPAPRGLLATNAPYGRRLGDVRELTGLHRRLGRRLLTAFRGWEAAVLTGERDLARAIGLRPRRRAKVLNAGLECHLLRYRIHAEPLPPQAEGGAS